MFFMNGNDIMTSKEFFKGKFFWEQFLGDA